MQALSPDPCLERRCDLCGLPVRRVPTAAEKGSGRLCFCCPGCAMVYRMLAEAADAPDPARFKETELYRRCLAAGVVPADEADLSGRRSPPSGDAVAAPPTHAARELLPLQVRVEGMWCPACAWVIQAAIARLPGVDSVVCDFATDRLRCCYDPVRTTPRAVCGTVAGLGYVPVSDQAGKHGRLTKSPFVRWALTALLSANVMMLSWALYSGFFTTLSPADVRYIAWPILAMATVVMLYGGGPLFKKAWSGIRAGAPGMEALVCLGAGGAYLYSLINFVRGDWHLYFDTAAMLITLVLLGKLLESRAKRNVRQDLESFLALQPVKVRLVSPQYPRGRFVVLERLASKDLFRVAAGEVFAADGRVLSGSGLVDAAGMTGESRPRTAAPGDPVTAGTTLIKGELTVETLRVGAQSLLGQMISAVESGLSRPVPLQSRTDRWLAIFVPVMAALAVATGAAVWWSGSGLDAAFERALSVLVIACPCALGLAIPLARVAGISRASRMGILVRDPEAFERAARLDDLVFDKTGTLTHGRWVLERVETHGAVGADQALALAAGLEKDADHAVARAVSMRAGEKQLAPPPVDAVQVEAKGVRGTCQGSRLRIGSWDYALPQTGPAEPPDPSGGLHSRVYLSRDGELVATFHLGDTLRAGTPGLIRTLAAAGHTLHLVSGDALTATRAAARLAGLAQVQGGLLPQDKAAVVARLQAAGRRVAMVGDGINDAPALARADLSVALYREANIARQAAAVTLMRGDPAQLPDFLALAAQVNATVVQNLTLAWVYNLIGVPIAMSGLLNPLVAATAMLLSSLTVIGNTLRLVRR